MMSDPGEPERPLARESSPPRGSESSAPLPAHEREWPIPMPGDPVIAVATTGAVTAMNVAAVTLLGPPAPHQFGLGLSQFIPARYHRVIEGWSERQAGDARAAHPDRLTLSLSALRADGAEVWVLLTRRMLGDGPAAPYLVTMREAPSEPRPRMAPIPRRVRQSGDHPSPVSG